MGRFVEKKSGYVFEYKSVRKPGKKNPVKENVKCIGKMVDGQFVPNSYYLLRESEKKVEELEKENKELKKEAEAQEKTVKENSGKKHSE